MAPFGEHPQVSKEEFYELKAMIQKIAEVQNAEMTTRAVMVNEMSNIKKSLEGIESYTQGANGRTRKLELWRSYIAGGLATLVVTLGILGWLARTEFDKVEQMQMIVDRLSALHEREFPRSASVAPGNLKQTK